MSLATRALAIADQMFGVFFSGNSGPVSRVGTGFEAASGGKRAQQLRRMPALNSTITASNPRLRSLARGLAANNPLAAAGIEAWVSGVAGDGIKPQSAHPDPAKRQEINALFDLWTDRADSDGLLDFYGLQGLVMKRVATDGEAFLVMQHDPDSGELRLRMLDPDQISADLTRDLGNSARIIAGVEFDEQGRRVAYHVNIDRPGLPLSVLHNPTVRLAAEDVIHVFRVDVPGQIRGTTWLASVAMRLAGLDVANDALLMRLQIASMLCGFVVTTPGGERVPAAFSGGVEDGTGGIVDGLEPGSMRVLDQDQDVRFTTPPAIGAESNEFMRATGREIAAGLGVPYELLTGDLSQANYSSTRTSLVEFRRRCESVQHGLVVFQFLRRVWRKWLTIEVLSGRLEAPGFERDPERYLAAKWMPPRALWIDPLKDAQAEAVAIASGLMSRRQAVAARGYDLEALDREIAEDRERAAALGLVFPGDAAPAARAVEGQEAAA